MSPFLGLSVGLSVKKMSKNVKNCQKKRILKSISVCIRVEKHEGRGGEEEEEEGKRRKRTRMRRHRKCKTYLLRTFTPRT